MIRNCLLFVLMITCRQVTAQYFLDSKLVKTSTIEWAVQQQLLLNEQPGKTLELALGNILGDYVIYNYHKLNDSVYREEVKKSSVEMSGDQLYIKRGNRLVRCFLWNGKYLDSDRSVYTDSSGYLVRERLRIKGTDSTWQREVHKVGINDRVTESWIYNTKNDTIEYTRYTDSTNCHNRIVYSVSGKDTLQLLYSHDCDGNGAELLKDKKVFVWSWVFNSRLDILVNEWIVPSGKKGWYDLIDFAREPAMEGGKLVDFSEKTRIHTNRNGVIEKVIVDSYSDEQSIKAIFVWK